MRGSVVLCSGMMGLQLGVWKKISFWHFKKVLSVIIDVKRQWTGSLTGKIDLCQGSYKPNMLVFARDPPLLRNFYVHPVWLLLFAVFVGSTMQAFPELIWFSMWPLFLSMRRYWGWGINCFYNKQKPTCSLWWDSASFKVRNCQGKLSC